MANSARTISKLAEADGIAPPLAPDTLPHWATARDGSACMAVSYPRTLNELRKYARHFGRAAARDTEWGCVTVWLMNCPPQMALSNPPSVAMVAVRMAREHDRFRLEYPRHDGKEPTSPALDKLSPDVREEALRVATETLSDWRDAGRPYLEPHRIESAYKTLISCPAFIERYLTDCGAPSAHPHKEEQQQ